MIRRGLSVLISLLLCSAPGLLPVEASEAVSETAGDTVPVILIDPDPERFRDQLLKFVQDAEAAITLARDHPLIGEEVRSRIAGEPFQVPLPAEVYQAIESLEIDDLEHVHAAFSRTPSILGAPVTLMSALQGLPTAPVTAVTRASVCGSNNYSAFDKIRSLKPPRRGLREAQLALALTANISKRIADALRAGLEDVPVIGSKVVVVLHVIWGVSSVTETVLGIAANALEVVIDQCQLAIDGCLADDGDVHPEDSGVWRGKGCDNRDNNCDPQGEIDELAEDRFAPEVFVDSAVLLECYPSFPGADAAARRAVTAEDDCKLSAAADVQVVDGACGVTVTATATDRSSNFTSVPFALKVDGDAPLIGMPSLAACYATLDGAHDALALTPVSDPNNCSAFSASIEVTEKECVADLRLDAIDECGNESAVEQTVRVDAVPPEVMIETLKIPAVDGLSCFASEAGAVDTVTQATVFSDNCSSREDLDFMTTTSGDACNLTVTTSASDECLGITTAQSSDSLLVRVDTEPPTISCTVAEARLWPPNGAMIDVGFSLQLSDNCDPQPQLDVTVTTDEPTRFAFLSQNGPDPFPDAEIERGTDGSIERILLRAQRRQTGGYDGRVYRIRVVATDACGLSSETECWVTVPATPQGTAVNSEQKFDATLEN